MIVGMHDRRGSTVSASITEDTRIGHEELVVSGKSFGGSRPPVDSVQFDVESRK